MTTGGGGGGRSPIPAAAWTVLALLMLLGTVAFLDRQVIALLVAPIKRDLAISDTQVSLLQGLAFALLYATAALPIGHAVDRHSRRLIIFGGVFVWGAAASLSGLATTFGALLTARVFVGLGEAALAPASYSILSDLFERTRLAFALSIYSIGSTLGSSLALVVAAALFTRLGDGVALPLLGHLRPWQVVLLVTGLPGLMLSPLVFAIPEPRRSAGGRGEREGAEGWAALIAFMRGHRRFFACHFSAFSCLMASAYAALSWIPSVLQRRFDWSIGEVGLVLGALSAAAGVIGLLANGALTDRLFARGDGGAHLRYYLHGSIAIGTLGLTASFMPTAALYLVVMSPVLMLNSFAGVGAAAIQIVTPAPLRGRLSALYLMTVSLFGLIVGPSAVALVSDHVVGPTRLHLALGLTYAGLMPVAAVCCAIGIPAMRRAVAGAIPSA